MQILRIDRLSRIGTLLAFLSTIASGFAAVDRGVIFGVPLAASNHVQHQDDLYQEILTQIWRGLPGLKEKQFANTWLYRVAINTAISFVRKRASRTDRIVYVEHTDLTRTIES
ncbi:MAG: hypothetical protein EXS35_18330 [Pedosphaera sp.]|nr:hypothetical protein [Pedosphaera sp.]